MLNILKPKQEAAVLLHVCIFHWFSVNEYKSSGSSVRLLSPLFILFICLLVLQQFF